MADIFKVLLVTDEETYISAIKDAFAMYEKPMRLVVVSSVNEALVSMDQSNPDFMIVDLELTDGTGLDLMPGDEDKTDFPIIVMNMPGNEQKAVEAIKRGAFDYVTKSGNAFAQLPRTVERALREWENIVKRKEAEAALAAEKERLVVLLRSTSDGVISTDAQGRVVSLNSVAQKLTGWTEDEAVGKPVGQVFHIVNGQTGERCENPIDDVLQNCGRVRLTDDTVLIAKDGKERILSNDGSPILDEAGRVVGVLLVFRDETDLKQAQDAVIASEARYRNLFDSMENAVAIYSAIDDGEDFVFLDFNKAGESVEKVSKQELLGKSIQEAFPAVKEFGLFEVLQRVWRKGEPERFPVALYKDERITGWRENFVYKLPSGELVAIYSDKTQYMAAKEALEQQVVFLETLLEAIPAPVFYKDIDHVYRGCNQAFADIMGHPKEKIINYSVYDVAPKELADVYRVKDEELFRNPGVQVYETSVESNDGVKKDVIFHKATFRDSVGSVSGLIGFILDITDRKRAEEALKESERRLSTLMANLPGIAYRCWNDPKWTMEFISEGCFELTGYKPEHLVNNKRHAFGDIIVPQDKEQVWEKVQQAVKKKKSFQVEYRIQTASGDIRWLWERGQVVPSADSGTTMLEGFISDVTERRKSAIALQDSERLLNNIIEQSPFALLITDVAGNLIRLNQACRKKLRISDEEVVGKYNILRDELVSEQGFMPLVRSVFSEGKTAKFEIYYDTTKVRHVNLKDNASVILDVTISPVLDKSGHVTNALIQYIDITEKKLTEKAVKESEEKYRKLVELMNDGLCRTDRNGLIIYANDKYAAMTGVPVEDMIGSSPLNYHDEQSKALIIANIKKRRQGFTNTYEISFLRKDDSQIPAIISAAPVFDANGDFDGVHSVLTDISDLKRTEKALKESEMRNRTIVETAVEGIWTIDLDGLTTYVNQQMAGMLGYTAEEMLGRSFLEFANDEWRQIARKLWGKHRGPVEERNDFMFLRKDGTPMWGLVSTKPLYDEQHHFTGSFAMITDITERKQAEDALKASEQKYRRIIETANEGVWSRDSTYRTTFVNQRWAEMLGYSVEEMLGRDIRSFMFELDIDEYMNRQQRRKLGEKSTYELRFKCKDGSIIWALVSASPIIDEDGTFQGSFAMLTDITEQKRTQQALKESEQKYRAVVDNIQVGISLLNRQMEIVAVNKSVLKYFPHVRPGSHQLCYEQYNNPPQLKACSYCPCVLTFQDGQVHKATIKTLAGDETLYFYIVASPIMDTEGQVEYVIELTQDITNQKRAEEERRILEEQLRQSQKMESIGTLASGIAHDFNNVLTIVRGYTELLIWDKDQDSPGYSELNTIQDAAKRGAELVKQILTFSRKVETNPRILNLNDEVRKTEKLLYRIIPKMIDIDVVLAEDLMNVHADPAQIEQVLMNLALNANHAMPDGGSLRIETKNVMLDEEYCKRHIGLQPGPHVQISVSDTGCGMDKDTLDRVFEPFFTTKQQGEGTGLGLAMVYGIIQGHIGQIYCYSKPGMGTSFEIFLPACKEEHEDAAADSQIFKSFGTETILMVDDEDPIRDLGTKILKKAGYSVLTASNGTEAIEMYLKNQNDIALVIMDFIMPEMSGRECMDKLLVIDPNVKIVIASGYTLDADTREAFQKGAKGFLEKPFRINEVQRMVRKVLDERSS